MIELTKDRFFQIKNWEKYQHPDTLRGHNPVPWIKLHTTILSDETLLKLSTKDALTWFKLLLLSARTRNKLSLNSAYIKQQLGLKRMPNLALFMELGLIEPWSASKLQATRKPRIDKKRIDKTRQEQTGENSELRSPASSRFEEHYNSNESSELLNQLVKKWNSNHTLVCKKKEKRPIGVQLAKCLEILKIQPDREFWESAIDAFSKIEFYRDKKYLGLVWLIKSGKAEELIEEAKPIEPMFKRDSEGNLI
jgi:hypothetical protein